MLKSVQENLQQLVFDEDKIVTYKLLTRLLKINVNTSKKYLQDFYDLNHEDLNASYVLVGVQKNEDEQLITKINVVPAAELEATKKSFVTVTSSHIYCIHKGQVVDKVALFSADCEGQTYNEGLNEYSSVRNPHVHIESQKRRINCATAPVIKQEKSLPPPVNKKQKVEEKKGSSISPVQEKKESISPPEKKPVKGNENSKGTNSKYKNSNIFSMFQKKQDGKKTDAQKESKNGANSVTSDAKTNEKEENQCVQSEHKGKKDIKSLFSKQSNKEAQLPKQNKEAEPSTVNKNNKRNRNSGSGTKQKRLSNKHKKKNDSDSDESMKPQKKKHRRIVELEDSESESENEELMDKAQRELVQCEPDLSAIISSSAMDENLGEDDDCIPPTPVAEGKKKKWKMVSKTFMDETGFLVTKKTKEYVTDSGESEDEKKELKSPAADNQPAKKPSFTNKKQASLMSFFRQK